MPLTKSSFALNDQVTVTGYGFWTGSESVPEDLSAGIDLTREGCSRSNHMGDVESSLAEKIHFCTFLT